MIEANEANEAKAMQCLSQAYANKHEANAVHIISASLLRDQYQQVGWLKQMKQKLFNTHHKLMRIRMKQMQCILFQLACCLTSSAIESMMLLTFL